jgi:hypothetical protein
MSGPMSLKIALALAAILGAGMLVPAGGEAWSEEVVVRGDDSAGIAAAKPGEPRFYSAFNQTQADGKAKRRASKPRAPAAPPPVEARRENPSNELRIGAFPFDPMIPNQRP